MVVLYTAYSARSFVRLVISSIQASPTYPEAEAVHENRGVPSWTPLTINCCHRDVLINRPLAVSREATYILQENRLSDTLKAFKDLSSYLQNDNPIRFEHNYAIQLAL
jgi:hypothetical protein